MPRLTARVRIPARAPKGSSNCSDLGRVVRDGGDPDPAAVPTEYADLSLEMSCKGTDPWTGEEEASEVARYLIDLADERGQLRGIMEAIPQQPR